MKLTTQASLALALVLLFAAVIGGAFLTRDQELARQLSEALQNIVIAIAAYYFGSSQGSRAKDAQIAAALNASSTPPTTPSVDPQPGDPQ